MPEGFGLLSELIEELAAEPAIAEERRVIAGEMLEAGEGSTLAFLRMRQGMSQSDLARAIGTSQAAVSRLEAGTQEPRLSTLRKLADALAVDLNQLGNVFPDE